MTIVAVSLLATYLVGRLADMRGRVVGVAPLPISAWGFEEYTIYRALLPAGAGPCVMVDTGQKVKNVGFFSVTLDTR
jgi:hypothetical protein